MKPFLLVSIVFGLGAFAGTDALSFQDLLDPYGLLSAVLFIGYNLDQKIGKLGLRIALIEQGRADDAD